MLQLREPGCQEHWRRRLRASCCRKTEADVTLVEMTFFYPQKNTSPCTPFSTSICLYVIGSPVSSLLWGMCFEMYWLYKCLSLSIWMLYWTEKNQSGAMLFFSGMKANYICSAIHSLILWIRREFVSIVWLKRNVLWIRDIHMLCIELTLWLILKM